MRSTDQPRLRVGDSAEIRSLLLHWSFKLLGSQSSPGPSLWHVAQSIHLVRFLPGKDPHLGPPVSPSPRFCWGPESQGMACNTSTCG